MGNINKLFSYKKIYDTKNTSALFIDAIIENLNWHSKNCKEYNNLIHINDFSIAQIKSIDDLYKIVPLPTLFLKANNWFSIKEESLKFKSTSSGTSGNAKSIVGLDTNSTWNAFKMVIRSFSYHKVFSFLPANYLILGFKPSKHNHIAASKTAFGMTLTTPTIKREYAVTYKNSEIYFNLDELAHKLLKLSKSHLPLRFMGFPAYLHFLLEHLDKNNIKLNLHPNSMVFTAGGWKQFYSEKQDKNELYAHVENTLGIKKGNCIDFFGAVEHPILYCGCKNNNFHIPIYSRALIRDVKTLEPMGFNSPGILNLISPLMKSMPLTSILTDDIAILHKADDCGCGIDSPYIEILGRAGVDDIKTCAANAADLLKVEI